MIESTFIIFFVVVIVAVAIAYWLGHTFARMKRDAYWQGEIPSQRKDAITRSRSVIGGQFSEQLAPYLPDFGFLPTECRFIGKPIDFIVFKGMDGKNIDEVVFVEVKSGDAKLSPQEKALKETIQNKKVRWVEYRIPHELTENKEMKFDDDGHAI